MAIKLRRKDKISNLVLFQSLLFAFFADIKPVNWGLVYGGYVENRIMSLLYSTILGLVFFTAFIDKKRQSAINGWSIVILVFLLIFYAFTYYFIGEPRVRTELFLSFVIMAFIIPHFIQIDVQLALKAIMMLPAFAIFRIRQIFFFSLSWQDSISMEASYAYLIPIIATIIYLKSYYRAETFFQKVLTIMVSIINIIFLIQLILYGSRGPLLSIIFLLIFLWITYIDKFGIKIRWHRFLSVIILSFIMIGSLMVLLRYLESFLADFDISFRFVDKIIDLESEDNLSNGRAQLNSITWSGILESPILGHGIDQYETNTGEVYPHNFLLQILYDGGILFFLILIPILLKKLIKKYENASKDEYTMYSFLLFASVPGAFFSQDLWNLSILWLFFGCMISNGFIRKKYGA